MKITFLGTGTSQGIPLIGCTCEVCLSENPKDKRLRSSILISDRGNNFVIDTGPDFRQQMLREKVNKLDAVLFTHEHKDHIAGLDEVRAFNFLTKKPIDIYASPRVQMAIRREFAYIFSEEKYPGIPELNIHDINGEELPINGSVFLPITVWHYKLQVYAFRINDVTYITDANYISEEEKKKIKGSRIIIVNALRRQKHISHFTFEEAIDLMKELEPEQAYFTHISHQLGKHDEVSKELPDFIRLAYDGLQIEC